MDRAYRFGQTREVNVYRLIGAGTYVTALSPILSVLTESYIFAGSRSSSTTASSTSAA